jgi:hypothetical protein
LEGYHMRIAVLGTDPMGDTAAAEPFNIEAVR